MTIEERLFREKWTGVGLMVGAVGGLFYSLATKDIEAATFFNEVLLDGFGGGAITGAGGGYCLSSIVQKCHNGYKKYLRNV